MKRHAAALALLGWYLMVPPNGPTPDDPLEWRTHAPLSTWQIDEVFDGAAECRAAREKVREESRRIWNSVSGNNTLDKKKVAEAIAESGRKEEAACIATNDPRLKAK